MPASEKQLAANRRNALRSTGPRTPAGKAVSACNALRHGLRSSKLLLPDEAAEEFADFQNALLVDLAPVGPIQMILAEGIIASAWRLRRAAGIERYLFIRLAVHRRPDGALEYLGAGAAWLREHKRDASRFECLSRYETRLHRRFHQDLQMLSSLQNERPRAPALPHPSPNDPSVP